MIICANDIGSKILVSVLQEHIESEFYNVKFITVGAENTKQLGFGESLGGTETNRQKQGVEAKILDWYIENLPLHSERCDVS